MRWSARVIFLIVALAVLYLYGSRAWETHSLEMGSSESTNVWIDQYNFLLTYALNNVLFRYQDNFTGRIVWNSAYFLDSLLNMFELTRDVFYLEIFVQFAQNVLAVRDDLAGRPDFAGRLRPGWQVNAYYTLGRPYVLQDVEGRPTLLVQAIRTGGNNYTTVYIQKSQGASFNLELRNSFRRNAPLIIRYDDLTMENVEHVVNANLSPRSLIRVQRLGSRPPQEGEYALKDTYAAVLHGIHTPAINIPFVRFAVLVRKYGLGQYYSIANEYLIRAQESFMDYQHLWREEKDSGYYIFDPQVPFWSAGFPVPYNALGLHGRFLLWLYMATKAPEYQRKTEALLSKIQTGITITPQGILRMPYWYGRPFQGWSTPEQGPAHRLYAQGPAFKASEDVSHFSLTLQFLFDAYDFDLFHDEQLLQAAAKTFVQVLVKPECPLEGPGKFLAHSLEGKGCIAGYPAGIFVRLAKFDPAIWDLAVDIYQAAYASPENIDPDYEYGYVLLGWSWIALMASSLQESP